MDGDVNWSTAILVRICGKLMFAVIAFVAAVGLVCGTKWGWALAVFHWTSRLCGEALLPLGLAIIASLVGDSRDAVRLDVSRMFGTIVFSCLLLYYLFRSKVLDRFCLLTLNKTGAVTSFIGISMFVAIVIRSLQFLASSPLIGSDGF
jgi:hypothetical protein